MGSNRYARRIDSNQPDIVKALRAIPGVSVVLGCNDILVGHAGKTYWYEIKSQEAVSNKTGDVIPSKIKKGQKTLSEEFNGHYRIVSCVEEIIKEIL